MLGKDSFEYSTVILKILKPGLLHNTHFLHNHRHGLRDIPEKFIIHPN